MLVTENQLDQWVWANARDAQALIVELVWRLVAASCPNSQKRFPLGDSIGQHGPDGRLEADLGFEPFVPEGDSLWEIGTGLHAGDKATSDYNDRTADVPPDVRDRLTFVFVTPLSGRKDWEHTWKEGAQAAWLKKRRNRGEWKDVRVIDGTRLVEWIHQFPAVELWLAQKISTGPMLHVDLPELHWDMIKSIGEPPSLTPDLFLADRTDACTKLSEVFAGTTMRLKLTTHYPGDVVDFTCAYLASLDAEERMDALGRSVIISATDAWNTICGQREKHILIADPALDLSSDSGTKLIQRALKARHAVIFGGPHGGVPDPASATLPMPRSNHVKEALEKAGYNEERARTLAQKSNGNLATLLRCIQNLSVMPEWAQSSPAAELAVALLLGSWNDDLQADRSIVEGLSGKAFGEWIGKMREIALQPSTPLIQRDGNWRFVSRYEGWYALGPRLFDEHLNRLWAISVSVLRERDPQFDLPREERYAARIHGKVLTHSGLLRRGLAESLALAGSHARALTSCSLGKAAAVAHRAVHDILAEADWVLWASLNDLLPLLAEAAPEAFLDAVERTLGSNPCPFDALFAQESDALLGRNYMTGLLWALETLAWDADHLSRVVLCLGGLAARDPGGNWSNRPVNSLTTILLPWLPQTCAPLSNRMVALNALRAEYPAIGWKLLVSLLPKRNSMSMRSRRPAWRSTIPDDWTEGVTHHEYWEQVHQYTGMAVSEAKNDIEKLSELVNDLAYLPPHAQELLLEHLASDALLSLPESNRLQVWNALVDLVSRHKKYADADWVMRPELVGRVEVCADRLAPSGPFFRHQRLFSERDFDLFEENSNYEDQMRSLEVRRQQAMQEVAASGGVQRVLAFAGVVQTPWRAGIAFGAVADPSADGVILPDLLNTDEKPLAQFAGGFVLARFRSRGWSWVDQLDTSQWNPGEIGQLLSFLPFTPGTWEHVNIFLGVDQAAYWTKTSANPFEATGGLEIAVERLLQYGRPIAAIDCLGRMLHDSQTIDSVIASRVLIAALASSEPQNPTVSYEIVEIIKALQNDPDTNPSDLVQIEWGYLPLLDEHHHAAPRHLWQLLADRPAFFCEMIRLVFRSREDKHPAEELSGAQKNVASNAYHLLSEWRSPPGYRADGPYDGEALASWLTAVQKECAETGHLEVAMTMVGQALVYTPPDPGGLWIHRSAAAALNAKEAGKMREGFHMGLINSRGVHWVDPTGKPERELAAKYRRQAEDLEMAGYHRLASTLRELASFHEREADRISSRDSLDDS